MSCATEHKNFEGLLNIESKECDDFEIIKNEIEKFKELLRMIGAGLDKMEDRFEEIEERINTIDIFLEDAFSD